MNSNKQETKVEDQAPAAPEANQPLAGVEGEDFDLGGVCGLNPDDPEFEGCTVCQ